MKIPSASTPQGYPDAPRRCPPDVGGCRYVKYFVDMVDVFRKFAHFVADAMGSKYAFGGAVIVVAGWAALGPHFQYSDTWQLVINTSTTIITFLMVFIIQYTQNRDARAVQLKLDELLVSVKEARSSLVDLEDQPDDVLKQLKSEFAHRLDKISDSPSQKSKSESNKSHSATTDSGNGDMG
jgi:low affinity Fe/Cu permease